MTEDLKLNMDAYLPLRDVVFNTLREAILKEDLKPGERLMEQQLAVKLGVSRTPIREAIRMLEQEGLAITTPRKGAEVAHMTLKDMEDVLQIREALEDLAVRIACQRINDEQIERLKVIADKFEELTKSGNVKALAECDVEFHDVVYEAADNPKLMNLLNNLREQLYRYRVEYLKNADVYPSLIKEHEEIVNALAAHNVEMATGYIHVHVENQEVAVKQIIEKQEIKK